MGEKSFEFKEEKHFLGFTNPSSNLKLNIGGDKKITALEWFFNQLSEKTQANNEKEYYQAKQIKKEQQFRFFIAGQLSMEGGGKDFEQYYNETYGE